MRKIVIIQSYVEVGEMLRDIVAERDADRARQMVVTDDPEKVIDVLREHPDAVIISGFNFNHTIIPGGSELARLVRGQAPDSLLFFYSSLPINLIPAENDGLIQKGPVPPTSVADFLCGISDSDSAEDLRKRFPFIQYSGIPSAA